MSDNLLEVTRPCQWFVHAQVFVFVIAILESTALVLVRCREVGHRLIDMSPRSGRYRLWLGLWLRIVLRFLSGFLGLLLLSFKFCLCLVIGEFDFVSFLVVEVRRVGVLLVAQRLGEDEGRMCVDVVDRCVFGYA